jgi:hypothetical protein
MVIGLVMALALCEIGKLRGLILTPVTSPLPRHYLAITSPLPKSKPMKRLAKAQEQRGLEAICCRSNSLRWAVAGKPAKMLRCNQF